MLKFCRFFFSSSSSSSFSFRKELNGKFLPMKIKNCMDVLRLGCSHRHYSTGSTDLTNSGRTFAEFSIFKGKAALSMSPIMPKFTKMDSGISKVDKRGVVLLKFMPAIGTRKYDWEKRQFFALSAIEVGSLISLGPTESCEFFHDPSMKSSLEGQVKKTLTVSPMGSDGGFFFGLSVLNAAEKKTERFSVPVTKAEYAVIRAACGFVLPHIMGWDQVVRPHLESGNMNQVKQREVQLDPDYEWGR
ncbi:single-stranded DNA-binding protein WHY2, mitochondrial [Dioscorea cayenensis subsp. rotundata]|uniref:Single-stranded DNA-binding protein WHY2, mitochondrial n=1 Tax=Dioscorea cayennensis subsp. rotundata TaxID=55577 RepID=A0AB40CIY4_DIOCR|nr:single-stranded DNA-binding protein WHY2, mitochondrial [Dioscorea cayenensis subsp. rotundata]